jgi:hypothetical protein
MLNICLGRNSQYPNRSGHIYLEILSPELRLLEKVALLPRSHLPYIKDVCVIWTSDFIGSDELEILRTQVIFRLYTSNMLQRETLCVYHREEKSEQALVALLNNNPDFHPYPVSFGFNQSNMMKKNYRGMLEMLIPNTQQPRDFEVSHIVLANLAMFVIRCFSKEVELAIPDCNTLFGLLTFDSSLYVWSSYDTEQPIPLTILFNTRCMPDEETVLKSLTGAGLCLEEKGAVLNYLIKSIKHLNRWYCYATYKPEQKEVIFCYISMS